MRTIIAAAALAALSVGACASDEGGGPAYVVVEENASIPDRRNVRRMSFLDDDALLIEARVGDLYRVDLIGPCMSLGEIAAPVRIEETGIGIDRSTRFIIGGRTCHVRSISKVERAPRAQG